MTARKPLCIVAGVGNATGTGAASAREFARTHRVAVLGRRVDQSLIDDIIAQGGEAVACVLREYTPDQIRIAYRKMFTTWPDSHLDIALWNASFWWRQPFLETTEHTIRESMNINVVCAFAFCQEALRAFLSTPHQNPHRGTIIVTGATSATRGAAYFSAFAAGKHASRAMTQSIAREFGEQGIHACFTIIDGTIETSATKRNFGSLSDRGQNWLEDRMQALSPASVARTYRWLHEQPTDAWTFELDLRPAKEKF